MSPRPNAHVYLKDEFLYYNRRRVYFVGGRSLALSRTERAILDCIERGESELGVLSRSLAELEIGGDHLEIATQLVADHSQSTSLLEIRDPIDVIEPQVIVCSFSPSGTYVDLRQFVVRLRRRFRVLHLGLRAYVPETTDADIDLETALEKGTFSSPFQFVQWARSFVRFHSRSVLVMSGTQDWILFGDLAATHYSFGCLGGDWPTTVSLQDILGSEALLRDPLASLQALFFAARMINPKELGQLSHSSSTELAALGLYGLRHASEIGYCRVDQSSELERLGRARERLVPLCVPPGRLRRKRPSTGTLALILDSASVSSAAVVVESLSDALGPAGLEEIVLRTEVGWLWVELLPGRLRVGPRDPGLPVPRPEVAVFFPGLARYLQPILDTMCEGVPTICYPTEHRHPLLVDASDAWTSRARTTEEGGALPAELRIPDTELHKTVRTETRRLLRQWSLVERVTSLVEQAEAPADSEK